MVGAGILVAARRIVTCTDVVIEALRMEDSSEPPAQSLEIDFPWSADPGIRLARVTAGGWLPGRDGLAGVAVMEVTGDEVAGATPAPLRRAGDPDRRMISVIGHPPGCGSGVTARARLVHHIGSPEQWIRMDGLSQAGRRIQKGFDGAGVWDEDKEAVVGCVVDADRTAQDRAAWMVPVEVIASYWPGLEGLIQPDEPGLRRPPTRPSPAEQAATAPPSGDWERLIGMFSALGVMADPSSRALLAGALERLFGGRLRVRRQQRDRIDTAGILHACLGHPGALHELVGLVRRYSADSEGPLVEAVARAVEQVDPAPLLTPADRNRLYELLGSLENEITAEMVMRCYRMATGPLRPANIDPSSLVSVVRALESATAGSDGLPPLVQFLEELSRMLGQPMAAGLWSWVDSFSGHEFIPHYEITRLRISSPPPPSGPVTGYVVTELTPDGPDDHRYITRITLRHGGGANRMPLGQVLYDSPRPLAIGDVPPIFEYVLSGVWDAASVELEDVVIEFVLPLELLGHAVDQWPIQTDVVAHPVCIDHLVVVRSADRRQLKRSHFQWRRKSVLLGHEEAKTYWMDPADESGMGKLYNDLTDERVLCLALTRPPKLPRWLGRDAVSIGIATGVPVIIWCRDESHAVYLTARLHSHFAQQNIAELPGLVQQLREAYVRSADPPVGAHVTLIWDVADRPSGLVTRHRAPVP